MTVWTSNEYDPYGGHAFSGHDTFYYLGIYVALGLLTQTVNFTRTMLFATAGVRASVVLHENVRRGLCGVA